LSKKQVPHWFDMQPCLPKPGFCGDNTEARKTFLKLFEFIGGERIIFPALRTSRHEEQILPPSPYPPWLYFLKIWDQNCGLLFIASYASRTLMHGLLGDLMHLSAVIRFAVLSFVFS